MKITKKEREYESWKAPRRQEVERRVVNPRKIPTHHKEDATRGGELRGFIMTVPSFRHKRGLKGSRGPKTHPESLHRICASIETCFYISSSSGSIGAPGSAVSKTPSEAQSFPSSTRINGPSSTRPLSDIGETDHPPGLEYGSDLNGTWDRRTTGAMSCLREAC
ncbi:hypothetical protein DY000_02030663 [Brassica cretica]|uniref:Uncharacterized protein n=1 Tax=Brassica cretica TaxID=69181 RepID=A0ABQ7DTC8_BRACR|nr:hypothetical protein DY000_02030663 [Brassica cretica]